MKLSLTPLFILVFIAIKSFSFAQETKRVVEEPAQRVKFIYYVLKENKKVKQGPFEQYDNDVLSVTGFFKMNKKDSVWQRFSSKGTLLSKKTYTEGKKTGVWDFNKTDGTLEWQYDFTNDSCINKPKETPYSYLSANGEWINGRADRDLIWLRSALEWQYYLTRNIRYPIDAIDRNKQGKVFVEITIDENGDAIDYSVPEKVYPSLDAEAIRVIKYFQPEFLPAEKDGKKVRSKIKLAIQFGLGR